MRTNRTGKVISFILSLCMLISLFTCLAAIPASASASDSKMLYVHSSDSANFFGWRTSSGGLSKATKYRLSLDWENIQNAPFGEDTFWMYCYSGGWKRVSSSNLTSEWTVSSRQLANGYHYDVDFTTTSPEELRELVLYFGDVNKSVSDMEFKTANWVLYTRDSEENLTDTGLLLTFPATFRGASDNAMNSYINSYTGTDRGQIWKKNGMSSQSEFIDIPEDYFAAPAACTHETTHLVEAVDSTCTTPGHDDYTVCDVCGEIVDGDATPWELDPEAHEKEVVVPEVASTCKTPGHTSYIACSGCGEIISGSNDQLPLDPNNHNGEGTELRDAIKATDHSTGYTGDTYCLGCGEKIADGEVTPIILKKMYHFLPGENAYQILVYKIGGVFEAGVYRFTIDEYAKTEVKSTVNLCVNGTAYTTEVGVDEDTLDTENNKRTVQFHLWGTKNDGALLVIGNRGKGDNMETYYANPELYLLDGEGNPTGENLIADFTEDNAVLQYNTSRANAAVGRWTGLNWHASRVQLDDYNPVVFGAECGHYVKEDVAEKASTCTTPGNIAHKVCKACGAYFDMEDNELTAEQIALPLDSENHEGEGKEYKNVVAATDDTAGYSGDTYCAGCGVKLADGHATVKQMLHFLPGDNGWQVMVYKISGAFEAGTYKFIIDEYAKAGVKSTVNLCVNSPAYTTNVEIASDELDTENNKRTVTFKLYGTKPDGALLLFGNYNNGDTMETYYANPELYLLDGEGEPTGENLVANFADNTVVFATGTNRTDAAVGKWTSLNWEASRVAMENYNATLYGKECKHILKTPVEAVASTCHTQGNLAYNVCQSCGAYLDNEDKVLADDQVLLPLDPNNHEGETEIRNIKDATCTEDGNKGDTYCLGCDAKIADGEVIKALGHTGGTATCCKKAVCTRCKAEYGSLNAKNHTGGTEIKGRIAATEEAKGYTGDTYCKGCGAKLSSGKSIDKLVINYKITYKLDGGKAVKNPATYTYATSTITLKNPTKKGYTFKGWYNGSKKVTEIKKGSKGNITLTAKWTVITYKINYKLAGGKNASANPKSYKVTTSTITLKAPTRKGYKFGGWYSDSKFTKKVTKIAKGSTGNKTLYAKWTAIEYKITYKLNSGKNAAKNPKSYKVTTKTFTLKNATRKGYTFKGWYSDSKFKKKVTKVAKGSTGNKTLYAKWAKK